MNLQEQHIRELLNAQRYEVNPQHEAAFRAMLVGKKRKRRTTAFFFIFLLTGAGLIAFSWNQFGDIATVSENTNAVEAVGQSAVQANADEAVSDVTTHESTIPAEDANTDQGAATTGHVKVDSPQQSNVQSSKPDNTYTSTRSAARMQPQNRPSTSDKSVPVIKDQNQRSPSGAIDSTDEYEADHSTTRATDADVQAGENTLNNNQVDVNSTAVDAVADEAETAIASNASGDAEIIPSTQLKMKSRFALGAAFMWSPVGIASNKSGLNFGNLFQFGGYGSYRLNPQWSVRAHAGIGIQKGGFTFNKSSENDVFGFGLNKERHEMRADQLYTGYVAAEMGRNLGRYQVFAGLQGQYLYGARGDIRREELLLDVPLPRVTTTENTWISASDLQQFSMLAMIGMRAEITARIHVSASARFPLLNTIRISSDAGAYDYEIASPGIAPLLGMSYQIYQQ